MCHFSIWFPTRIDYVNIFGKDKFALKLIGIIDDLVSLMTRGTSNNMIDICSRLDNLKNVAGLFREKLLDAKMKLEKSTGP